MGCTDTRIGRRVLADDAIVPFVDIGCANSANLKGYGVELGAPPKIYLVPHPNQIGEGRESGGQMMQVLRLTGHPATAALKARLRSNDRALLVPGRRRPRIRIRAHASDPPSPPPPVACRSRSRSASASTAF